MKSIIGKELITDPNTAIFELVKNSYDANASKVTIIFENVNDPEKKSQPRIIIVDNGDGMSRDDIENKWLFAGFSEKKFTWSKDMIFGLRTTKQNRVFSKVQNASDSSYCACCGPFQWA